MKKMFVAALFCLPLLAVPAKADWCPWRIDVGGNLYIRVNGPGGPGLGQLGPWYQYWPLEAHFQTPAPVAYPYWSPPRQMLPPPTPQTPPKAATYLQSPYLQAAPTQNAANYAAPYHQPVGYFYEVPSYWYGR